MRAYEVQKQSLQTTRARPGALRIAVLALSSILAFAACDRPSAPQPVSPEPATPPAVDPAGSTEVVKPEPVTAATPPDLSAVLPSDYRSYAVERLADGRWCVAGASLSGDLQLQTPRVYEIAADAKRIVWERSIDIPAGHHQARATHCVDGGDRVFVLVQSDTQASAALSQTFLRAVGLDAASGEMRSQQMLKPDTAGASYSAWVGDDGRFAVVDGRLTVHGHYSLLTDREKYFDFDAAVAVDAR